ncbi:hypothetical protein BDZ91DRAFT_728368 [Kalaharituber pfeilii]|nr:hypothetical protein BDZ91DRAFT_728368 [Kalaharituber pfeilii]
MTTTTLATAIPFTSLATSYATAQGVLGKEEQEEGQEQATAVVVGVTEAVVMVVGVTEAVVMVVVVAADTVEASDSMSKWRSIQHTRGVVKPVSHRQDVPQRAGASSYRTTRYLP